MRKCVDRGLLRQHRMFAVYVGFIKKSGKINYSDSEGRRLSLL